MNSENNVWKLLNDLSKKNGITEVIINGSDKIFIEKDDQFFHLNASLDKKNVEQFIDDVAKFNGKEINLTHPILDGKLPDGSRVNIIIEPFACNHPAITIRKYIKTIRNFSQNENIFGLDQKLVKFLKLLVTSRSNIVVAGGTGVGKTTFLNMLLNEVPTKDRVITIEDTRELDTNIINCVSLETTSGNSLHKTIISMRDLVKNSLRMRPDRIIIGEVRGGEIFDLLQAMNTGHDGSLTSIHANNPSECLSRMETLYLMAGFDMPIRAVREQISSAIHFIIQLGRNSDGVRVVKKISEISGMEQDRILMSEIATYSDNGLVATGIVPRGMDRLIRSGLERDFFK